MSLFGRVPFGKVNNDPKMIITQITYLISLFFLLLGISITGLEVWQAFISVGDPPTVPQQPQSSGHRRENQFKVADFARSVTLKERDEMAKDKVEYQSSKGFVDQAQHAKQVIQKGSEGKYVKNDVKDDHDELQDFKFGTFAPISIDYKRYLHGNFYVSFNSLFVPTAIGESTSAISADVKFLLAHIVTAILICYPAAICVERRRFVLDFIVSLYLVYIALTCLVTQTVFQPFTYWLGCLVSSGISFVGTAQIVYKREMAEVLIPNDEEPSQTVGST